MRAIILAAGRGSRMKTLTEKIPKCLVHLREKPLIEWQLAAIREAGITEIAVVTGYKRELLSPYKLVEFHNERWFETNMLASLMCAEKWLNFGPCIISYSDIFYDKSAVLSLINSSAKIALTFDPNWLSIWSKRFEDPLSDAETFLIDPSNQIIEIGNKPKTVEEVQGQYMGLLRITPEGWSQICSALTNSPKRIRDEMSMTAALQKVIRTTKFSITGIPYENEWGEIDNPNDLDNFNQP